MVHFEEEKLDIEDQVRAGQKYVRLLRANLRRMGFDTAMTFHDANSSSYVQVIIENSEDDLDPIPVARINLFLKPGLYEYGDYVLTSGIDYTMLLGQINQARMLVTGKGEIVFKNSIAEKIDYKKHKAVFYEDGKKIYGKI